MTRAFMLLMILCFAGQASADTSKPGQRAELQIGGPLRIVRAGEQAAAGASREDVGSTRLIEPSHGVSSSLSQVLNDEGQVLNDIDFDQTQDPNVAYSLTRSVSIGIGYHFVDAEDLVADLAVIGTLDADHQSHHLLFRANWHFQ